MQSKKILLVDDEEIILESLSHNLMEEGFEVITAQDGRTGIAELAKAAAPFDLVITDLSMAGMDGIGVLEEAKRQRPDTGVFILTGYGDMASAIRALRLGADDYLLKPCDLEELLLRMSRFFEKQEALRKVTVYEQLIPVCCQCGEIRDDRGVEPGTGPWMRSDVFLQKRSTARVTHSYCPKCFEAAMALLDRDKG